jgi:hypothetical protein
MSFSLMAAGDAELLYPARKAYKVILASVSKNMKWVIGGLTNIPFRRSRRYGF